MIPTSSGTDNSTPTTVHWATYEIESGVFMFELQWAAGHYAGNDATLTTDAAAITAKDAEIASRFG
jgi:hypothetical protein